MSVGLDFLSAVIDTKSLVSLRDATEDHFVDDEEKSVYNYVVSHMRTYGEIPSYDAVIEETDVELPEVEDSVDYYWSRLVNRKLYNDIREPYNELRKVLADSDLDAIPDIVARMSRALIVNREQSDLLPVDALGERVLDRYDQVHRSPGVTGVPSGWPTLDDDSSGYQPGDLVVWVARPGTGKTWLMLRQALLAHRAGRKVLFVTMEMSLVAIGNRFYGMAAGINSRMIRSGTLSTRAQNLLRRTIRQYRDSERLHFYGGNMGQGIGALTAVITEHQPDVVFIDGLYLLKPVSAPKSADRFQKVAYVLDELKTIALSRHIPIVGSSQFNRDRNKKGNQALDTIGYTDAFSTHSSLVYGIDFPPPTALNQESRVIDVIKGREGESRSIAVNYRFSPINFDETDLEHADPNAEPVDMEWMRNANR